MSVYTSFSQQQPVVLLTDIMDNDLAVLIEDAPHEQTEPLNLCLNVVELIPEFIDCGNLPPYEAQQFAFAEGGERDDDVIFVKEYRVEGAAKAAPRRNPVRRTRTSAGDRFKEYTDGSVLDYEKNDESLAKYEEDVDDWNVGMCRTRQKRRYFAPASPSAHKKPKYSTKMGRRRTKSLNSTNNNNEEPNLVRLSSLEPMLEQNLLLLKDYLIEVSKKCRKEFKDGVVELFRQQAAILLLAKGGSMKNPTIDGLIDEMK